MTSGLAEFSADPRRPSLTWVLVLTTWWEEHMTDIKQTGWDRGLPGTLGGAEGDDRDDSYLGEPRKAFQRRGPLPRPLMSIVGTRVSCVPC